MIIKILIQIIIICAVNIHSSLLLFLKDNESIFDAVEKELTVTITSLEPYHHIKTQVILLL
jgi:hypothetical protein